MLIANISMKSTLSTQYCKLHSIQNLNLKKRLKIKGTYDRIIMSIFWYPVLQDDLRLLLKNKYFKEEKNESK